MTLGAVAQGMSWIAVVITAGIAVICIRDPRAGLRKLHHIAEELPAVMLGRYLAFFGFTAFVAWWADLRVLAGWTVVLAFMSFFDTIIYARLGKPYMTHLSAGVAALAMLAVTVSALISTGAA